MSYVGYERRVLVGGEPEKVPGLDPANVIDTVPVSSPGHIGADCDGRSRARGIGDPTVPEGRMPCRSSFPTIVPSPRPVGIQATCEAVRPLGYQGGRHSRADECSSDQRRSCPSRANVVGA